MEGEVEQERKVRGGAGGVGAEGRRTRVWTHSVGPGVQGNEPRGHSTLSLVEGNDLAFFNKNPFQKKTKLKFLCADPGALGSAIQTRGDNPTQKCLSDLML